MTKSEAYLQKLKSEADLWKKQLDALPGNTVSVNHTVYRMSVNASAKYAAAAHMRKLMLDEFNELEPEVRIAEATPRATCDTCTDKGHCPEYRAGALCVADRGHGRWKGAGMGDYSCSVCGEVVSGCELSECPACHAEMEVQHETC